MIALDRTPHTNLFAKGRRRSTRATTLTTEVQLEMAATSFTINGVVLQISAKGRAPSLDESNDADHRGAARDGGNLFHDVDQTRELDGVALV